jgi:hypothetical protein
LKNSAERLRLLFGTQGSLALDLSHADVAIVRVQIPQVAAQPRSQAS